jgi:bifunctional enzyme CysN/CysC
LHRPRPKGPYRRALAGELRNFTDIDQIYEPAVAAELTLKTDLLAPDELADLVIEALRRRGIIGENC